jgi:hypothetical protein
VAATVVTLGVAFWPVAVRRMFVYYDLGNAFLPLRLFFAESLEAGRTALWMPHLFTGFYAHGEGQIGIAHPLRWLLYQLAPVTEAFNVECIVGYPLAVIGMALFCRRLGLPGSAATFGGIVFGFSPYLMLRLCHLNTVLVLAHVGWLLFAIDLVLRGESGWQRDLAWVGVAILTGSQLLVGYPGAVYFSLLIEGLWVLHVASTRRQLMPLVSVLAAGLVGVMIGGVQLIPTLGYLGDSVRVETTFEYRAEQSLHPWNLLQLWAPWLFRDRVYQVGTFNPIEQTFYLGAVVPVALTWVVVRWSRLGAHRSLLWLLAGGSALALLAAFGSYGPVYTWIAKLPLVGALRIPSRYTLIPCFASAIVAAIAFADLLRAGGDAESRGASRWVFLAPGCGWVLVAAALSLRQGPAEGRGLAAAIGPASGLMLGASLATLAALLFFAAARGVRGAPLALVLLTLADQASYGASLWWREPPKTLEEYVASIETPPVRPPERFMTDYAIRVERAPDGQLQYRAVSPMSARGARLVAGYVGLMPSRVLDYSRPNSLRVAGASAVQMNGRNYALPGALPRARLVSDAVSSLEPRTAIENIDVERTAAVEAPLDLVRGPPGDVRILEDLPGRIRLRAQTPTKQLLVLSESFHDGWKLSVDGAGRPPIRVYGDFMGCIVAPGSHDVVFEFAPEDYAVGLRVSLAGVVVAAAALLLGAWRRRRVAAR